MTLAPTIQESTKPLSATEALSHAALHRCPRCHAMTPGSPCCHCQARFAVDEEQTRVVDKSAIKRMPTEPITTPGGYTIARQHSRGGMGMILEATQISSNKAVIIKAPLKLDEQARQRFTREAQALSSLDHPSIVRLLDIDVTPAGVPLLVLQRAHGVNLRQLLNRGPLPLPLMERLLSDLFKAMDHAHRRGVIHRDLKPENLMVSKDGLTVLDFGIARVDAHINNDLPQQNHLTPVGSLLGSPPYAAPEQLGNARFAGPSADLYSCGMILKECLGLEQNRNELPRIRPEWEHRRQQWLDLSQALCHVDPKRRPPSDKILHFLGELPDLNNVVQLHHKQQGKRTRQRLWAAIVLGALVGIIAVLASQPQQHIERQTISGHAIGASDIVLQAQVDGRLLIRPLDGTRVRLPGQQDWRSDSVLVRSDDQGRVFIQVSDIDGHWVLDVQRSN